MPSFWLSFMIWLAIEKQNHIVTDDSLSEKSMLSGVMYKVEDDIMIDGVEAVYYSFATSEMSVERQRLDENNQFTLTRLKQEVHTLAGKESRLAFSFILLLYIMLCWLILHKHIAGSALSALAFVACSYYLLSIWQIWMDIQQIREVIAHSLAKL